MEVLKGFFVFEGVDGVGKTTALKALKELCERKGKAASFTSEPTSGMAGTLARNMLERGAPAEMLAYLFAADRHDHLFKEGGIYDMVKKGAVFCDRYRFSNTVYQAFDGGSAYIKGPAKGSLVWHLNKNFPFPEGVYFFFAPIDVILERQKERDGKSDSEKHVRQLAAAYEQHRKYIDHYGPRGMAIYPLDATLSPEEIAKTIYETAFLGEVV